MASTYSDLKFELIGTGEQSGTWGTTTNTNLGTAIEEAITGSADVSFSSADVTLTLTDTNASQSARNLRLNLSGTSGGARNLIVPAIEKFYIVNNGLADACTVKVSGQTGIAVPAGKAMLLFNNATDVVDAVTHFNTASVGTLTLTNALAVAQGGTGATSAAAARTNLGAQAQDSNLDDVSGLAVTDGNIIVGDGSNFVAESGATARTSLGLGDLSTKNTVATADIDADAVTNAKIGAGAVDTTELAADAVDGTKIADDAVDSEHIADDAVGAAALDVTGDGTSGQYLASDADGSMTWTTLPAGGGKSVKAQRFTASGTWTKPSSTSTVEVIVIGGGGGCASPNTGGGSSPNQIGHTSSFGTAVSCTGGGGGNRVSNPGKTKPGAQGVATISSGTEISKGSMRPMGNNGVFSPAPSSSRRPGVPPNDIGSSTGMGGIISGWQGGSTNTTTAGTPFNPLRIAGAGGGTSGTGPADGGMGNTVDHGGGGAGFAHVGGVPVTGPVAVTVGQGGSRGPGPSPSSAGVDGIVVVKWIEE